MDRKKAIIVDFFNEVLDLYEIELSTDLNSNSEEIFRLYDIQGANWSNINNSEFYTLADVIERLDSLHKDYIYRSLEDREDSNEIIAKDDWDLTVKRCLESDTIAELLFEITPRDYQEIMKKNERFDIKEVVKILDEDEEFKNNSTTHYDLILEKVKEYFKENEIKDLMDYGSDADEGLYHLSSMYKELMDELNIKINQIYTEDVSDGKYLTIITLQDNSQITVDTSAWNGIKVVTENIESIYEKWNSIKEKDIKEQAENEMSYL